MEQERREMKPPPVQPSENTAPPTPPPQKCPRCDSPNMKFCYYNNYSTSQPRYFCKACRRYWTHGGTLRNVPVGGGCRRPKRAKPLSFFRVDSSTPHQLAQPVAAPHFLNGGFSSSSVAMNSFVQPQTPFQVGSPPARLSFSPFDQQPQNQHQTEFYQMANQGLVEANRVLSFLNQTLENNNNNNNNSNNNNNGSNPNLSDGTSFNFLGDFPSYSSPSS